MGALRNAEWESELSAAHALTLAKLPKRTREILAMPGRVRAKLILERRRVLAERAEEKLALKGMPRKRGGPSVVEG